MFVGFSCPVLNDEITLESFYERQAMQLSLSDSFIIVFYTDFVCTN